MQLSWAHCNSRWKRSSLLRRGSVYESLNLWKPLEVRMQFTRSCFFRYFVLNFSQKCGSFVYIWRVGYKGASICNFFLLSSKWKLSRLVIVLLIGLICISIVTWAHVISAGGGLIKPSIFTSKAIVSFSSKWSLYSNFLSSSSFAPSFSFFHITWTA